MATLRTAPWILLFVSFVRCAVAGPVAAEAVALPQQVARLGAHAILAGDGVRAVTLPDGLPEWQVLQGLQTFAPTASADALFVGSSDGLLAIDPANGRLRWRIGAGQTIFSPLRVGDTLYAGSRHGELLAIDADSGRLRWRRVLPGWVYTPAWSDGALVTGGSAARLWWLDAQDGRLLRTEALDQELVFSPTAVAGGVLAATFAGTTSFYGHDARLRWRRHGALASGSPLALGDKALVTGLDGSLRLLALADGRPLWRGSLGSRITRPPLLAGDRALLLSDSGQAGLLDGEPAGWRWRLPLPPAWAEAHPLVLGGHVLLIDPNNARPRVLSWSVPTGAGPKNSAQSTEEER